MGLATDSEHLDGQASPGHSPDPKSPGRAVSLYQLTKPGIAVYVAMTAGVCYYVGARGEPSISGVFHTLVGTLLATGGALALNQYVERDVDALMKRTRGRPLPSGRVTPREALAFGVTLLSFGVGYLWGFVGWLPASITALSAASYLWVYTPLKKRSYLATIAGSFPGAFPALIGWTAATGRIESGGMVLFGIAFLWQLPHVLALAWLLKEDYQRVGFFMVPSSDPTGARIGRHMVYHSISLLILSLAPTFMGMTGNIYLAGAAVLGLGMLATAARAARSMSRPHTRSVFLASLLYQPLLLGLLLIDTVPLP